MVDEKFWFGGKQKMTVIGRRAGRGGPTGGRSRWGRINNSYSRYVSDACP
jgi:hypothetical protein